MGERSAQRVVDVRRCKDLDLLDRGLRCVSDEAARMGIKSARAFGLASERQPSRPGLSEGGQGHEDCSSLTTHSNLAPRELEPETP